MRKLLFLLLLIFLFMPLESRGDTQSDGYYWGFIQCSREGFNKTKNCGPDYNNIDDHSNYNSIVIKYVVKGHRHGSSAMSVAYWLWGPSGGENVAGFACSGPSCGVEWGGNHSGHPNPTLGKATITRNNSAGTTWQVSRIGYVMDAYVFYDLDVTAYYDDGLCGGSVCDPLVLTDPPPSVPSVSISCRNGNEVTVQWSNSANATSYRLQRRTGASWHGSPWPRVFNQGSSEFNNRKFTDNNPIDGRQNIYMLFAVNSSNETVGSPTEVSVNVPGDCGGGAPLPSPPIPPSSNCGNGVIDISDGEQCDGSNLGGQTCSSLGVGTGTPRCSNVCTFDTSSCTLAPSCGPPGMNADLISYTINNNNPLNIITGVPFPVSVKYKNIGNKPWTFSEEYRLSSINPNDNLNYSINRVDLPDNTVNPDDTVTFNFMATAQSSLGIGIKSFSWGMVKDSFPSCRFGESLLDGVLVSPCANNVCVSTPECTDENAYISTVSWNVPPDMNDTPAVGGIAGYFIDVSRDGDWSWWWNKPILFPDAASQRSTTAMIGFSCDIDNSCVFSNIPSPDQAVGPMLLTGGFNYFYRVWNGSQNYPSPMSYEVPYCANAGSPKITGLPTCSDGTVGSTTDNPYNVTLTWDGKPNTAAQYDFMVNISENPNFVDGSYYNKIICTQGADNLSIPGCEPGTEVIGGTASSGTFSTTTNQGFGLYKPFQWNWPDNGWNHGFPLTLEVGKTYHAAVSYGGGPAYSLPTSFYVRMCPSPLEVTHTISTPSGVCTDTVGVTVKTTGGGAGNTTFDFDCDGDGLYGASDINGVDLYGTPNEFNSSGVKVTEPASVTTSSTVVSATCAYSTTNNSKTFQPKARASRGGGASINSSNNGQPATLYTLNKCPLAWDDFSVKFNGNSVSASLVIPNPATLSGSIVNGTGVSTNYEYDCDGDGLFGSGDTNGIFGNLANLEPTDLSQPSAYTSRTCNYTEPFVGIFYPNILATQAGEIAIDPSPPEVTASLVGLAVDITSLNPSTVVCGGSTTVNAEVTSGDLGLLDYVIDCDFDQDNFFDINNGQTTTTNSTWSPSCNNYAAPGDYYPIVKVTRQADGATATASPLKFTVSTCEPVVSNVVVDTYSDSYCDGPHARISWDYDDLASPPNDQQAYQVAISTGQTAGSPPQPSGTIWYSPIVLSSVPSVPSGGSDSYPTPAGVPLNWNTPYRAWVKTQSTLGIWTSSWKQMEDFCHTNSIGQKKCNQPTNTSWTTPLHAYPDANVPTYSPSKPAAKLPVQFVDQSVFATAVRNWDWDFGGGSPILPSTVNSEDPIVEFPSLGKYTINLTVSDDVGSCQADPIEINVQKVIPFWREVTPL